MDEQRKYAILFAATILAARKLHEIGAKPCPGALLQTWAGECDEACLPRRAASFLRDAPLGATIRPSPGSV